MGRGASCLELSAAVRVLKAWHEHEMKMQTNVFSTFWCPVKQKGSGFSHVYCPCSACHLSPCMPHACACCACPGAYTLIPSQPP